MSTKRVLLIAFASGALLTLAAASADARVAPKADQVRLTSLSSASLGDCCAPKEDCCLEPCITYRHCGPKLCCGCEPPTEITLKVKNPCTGCETDVQVCLPACCTGEPTVCAGTGLFCRDVIHYEWCCGFRVKVAFKHCGDLIVTTWGR